MYNALLTASTAQHSTATALRTPPRHAEPNHAKPHCVSLLFGTARLSRLATLHTVPFPLTLPALSYIHTGHDVSMVSRIPSSHQFQLSWLWKLTLSYPNPEHERVTSEKTPHRGDILIEPGLQCLSFNTSNSVNFSFVTAQRKTGLRWIFQMPFCALIAFSRREIVPQRWLFSCPSSHHQLHSNKRFLLAHTLYWNLLDDN